MAYQEWMSIILGTSGYSYDDWKGKFYPPLTKPADMLPFYAKFFSMTEVNSTYYRIPVPQMFEHMLEKVPPDFIFTVKAFRGITHERPEDARLLVDQFNEGIAPLTDTGRCSAILLQFPYSFENNEGNRNYLLDMKDRFFAPIIVEFRNNTWITDETFQMLELAKIGFCCVDEPRMKGLMPPEARVTSDTGYLRFHGRNAQNWFAKDSASLRYDYEYRENELQEWVQKIKAMGSLTKTFFVLFNNHPNAYAVRNAAMMAKLLDMKMPAVPTAEDYDDSLNKFL